MDNQTRVRRIDDGIEVTVRGKNVVLWDDVVAKAVAEAILDEVQHSIYKEGEKVPRVGDKVKIKDQIPEDWDDSWWPAGEVGRITGEFYDVTDKQQCYIVEFDDEESNSKIRPDYYWAEDLEIDRTS